MGSARLSVRVTAQHSTVKQTLPFTSPSESLTQRIPESQNSRCLSDPCATSSRTFDIFFGVAHNKQAKQGWRFAADAARITDECASSEDRTHTSGGVFVAVDSNLENNWT